MTEFRDIFEENMHFRAETAMTTTSLMRSSSERWDETGSINYRAPSYNRKAEKYRMFHSFRTGKLMRRQKACALTIRGYIA